MLNKIIAGIWGITLFAGGYSVCFADINNGKNVFNEECAECHSLKEGKNKKGPSLWNILGRKSGYVSDFNYSEGMRNAQLVWTAEQIAAYIEHPKKVIPGGKMKYDGLDKPADRADVIEFLATFH